MSRILFLATHHGQSTGYAKIGTRIANALADAGYQVYYYALQNFGNYSHRTLRPSIQVIDVEVERKAAGIVHDPFAVELLPRYLHTLEIDVLFLYNDAILLSRVFNLILNQTRPYKIVSYLDLVYDFERKDMIEHIDRYSDLIFVFSDYWKKHLETMGTSTEIKVFPHGITETIIPLDRRECRKKLSLDPKDFIILNTNRNSYRKAWEKTIEAFLLFYKKAGQPDDVKLFANCNMEWESGYNIRNVIAHYCERLDLDLEKITDDVIKTFGTPARVSDETINWLYNACNIGVNTCVGEGFGLCNVEHASVGAIQVVSKVGAFHDNLPSRCFKITPVTEMLIPKSLDAHAGYIKICNAQDFANVFHHIYQFREGFGISEELKSWIRDNYNWEKLLRQFLLDFVEIGKHRAEYTTITYTTDYGKITLHHNEEFIGETFRRGNYWDHDTLGKMSKHVPKDRDVLEIGGHCGTSTLYYAKHITKDLHVFEPQKKMFDILQHNISQNDLDSRVHLHNKAVFCTDDSLTMHNETLDGNIGDASKDEFRNFGGLAVGKDGEKVESIRIDSMELEDVGFIHCDAQGSENFIFYGGRELLRKCRPVILFENNLAHDKKLHDHVVQHYGETYPEAAKFSVIDFCMDELNYNKCIDRFNDGVDTLLLP